MSVTMSQLLMTIVLFLLINFSPSDACKLRLRTLHHMLPIHWLVDSGLLNRIQSPSHCLSHLLPPEKHHLGLRPRGHSYALPICPNNLCKSCLSPDADFVSSDHDYQCVLLLYLL